MNLNRQSDRRSRYESARTFVGAGGPPRSHRSYLHQDSVQDARLIPSRPSQHPRSNISQHTPPSARGGLTTAVRPGQPHYFDTRADVPNARIISTMCRCRNPDSHGNAFTGDLIAGEDIRGREITWLDLMNRILDHYATATVSHQQEEAAWRYILRRETAADLESYYRRLQIRIGMGLPLAISPEVEAEFHNGDGHEQRFVGEQGLQTVMTTTGLPGGRRRGIRGYFPWSQESWVDMRIEELLNVDNSPESFTALQFLAYGPLRDHLNISLGNLKIINTLRCCGCAWHINLQVKLHTVQSDIESSMCREILLDMLSDCDHEVHTIDHGYGPVSSKHGRRSKDLS